MKKKYNLKSYGQTFLCIQVMVVTYWEILNIEDLFSENYFKMWNLKEVLLNRNLQMQLLTSLGHPNKPYFLDPFFFTLY